MMSGLIELALASVLFAAPVVVLDPGHGGARTGAVSELGYAEKDIALQIAKHTQSVLLKSGVRTFLTRGSDVYIKLDARTAFANRKQADVFVSIHANSSPTNKRRGCETYVLSAKASEDVSAAALQLENEDEAPAKFMNEAKFGGGTHAKGSVSLILRDLKRSVNHRQSARLAKQLQDAMKTVPHLGPSRGLRQAPFKVLRGAQMPAALVEVGYLTHLEQARFLASKTTQKRAGRALAQGILAFLALK
jgi:N-acetylmuramoyl-L-alanine amidase